MITFPDYKDSPYICVDLETYDPYLRDKGASWVWGEGFICGAAIGALDCPPQYYAAGHTEGNNIDHVNLYAYLYKLINTGKPILAFNWPYEAGWIKATSGLDITKNPVIDPMAAEVVYDNSLPYYNLDYLSQLHLKKSKNEDGINTYAKQHHFKAKENMHRIPGNIVGEYACDDVSLEIGLWEFQKHLLDQYDLWKVFDLECSVLPIVAKMKERGVCIDLEKVQVLKKEFHDEEKSLEREVAREAGFYGKINVWSGASLARLFDKIGLSYGRTSEGNPSFTSSFLESQSHPIPQKVLRIKRLNKLRNTFLAGLERLQHNGKIHPDYHAGRSDDGGTVTGRFSCSNPNDQQVPTRTEEGNRVRECYIPESGKRWGNFDYKQQEPRLSIHYAAKLGISGIDYWVDKYTREPDTDFYTFILNLCGIPRQDSKTITLGIEYGMGKDKLAAKLGKSPESAAVDIHKFHEHVPWMKPLMNKCSSIAEQRGWLKSYFGRRFMIDKSKSYKALNHEVQGTGGEQIKKAMVDIYKQEKIVPESTIHDELNLSIEDVGQARRIKQIMKDAIELVIPVGVDAGIDINWSFAKKKPEIVV